MRRVIGPGIRAVIARWLQNRKPDGRGSCGRVSFRGVKLMHKNVVAAVLYPGQGLAVVNAWFGNPSLRRSIETAVKAYGFDALCIGCYNRPEDTRKRRQAWESLLSRQGLRRYYLDDVRRLSANHSWLPLEHFRGDRENNPEVRASSFADFARNVASVNVFGRLFPGSPVQRMRDFGVDVAAEIRNWKSVHRPEDLGPELARAFGLMKANGAWARVPARIPAPVSVPAPAPVPATPEALAPEALAPEALAPEALAPEALAPEQEPAPSTARLCSSYGYIDFDPVTGLVNAGASAFSETLPERIDVVEWRLHYPGGTLAPGDEHDILDFGMWMPGGQYEAPEEGWRRDREADLFEEARDLSNP